jgi:antitoxin (DNA-binding transcriptional repressor) of toxin-antitoxin stability system
MTIIHLSEADAIRDFAAVLAHVRAGAEVVIDNECTPVAVLIPPTEISMDAEHDAWVRSQIQEALDDPRPGIPEEEVEAYFAQRRAASLLRAAGSAG